MTIIEADRLVAFVDDRQQLRGHGYVRIADGLITEVGDGAPPYPADISLTDGLLAPGLIDLQVNGYFGHDLVETDEAGWSEVIERLPETGCTAFCPTFITAPIETLTDALRRAREIVPRLPAGSRVLGVHVEGPFLSERRRGAHNADWLRDPTPADVAALIDAGGDLFAIQTLAPERAGGLAAVGQLVEAGVVVSVGHSDATAEQVSAAADAGARMVTHIFNGQSPLHHREPGVPAQALIDDRLTSGMVGDLCHVAAPVCRLAFAAAPGRIALVTDALASSGMPPGRYDLGGQPVVVEETGPARRPDGTLAGSTLGLDRAVANMIDIGIDTVAAIDAVTRVPADLIGRPELGRIAAGATADLVWLDDRTSARAAWVGGERVS